MDRGIGPLRILAAALIALVLGASLAEAVDRRVAERFRAAAAMQDRGLYDLAEAEFATIAMDSAADTLAVRARLQRSVCLFQLRRYAEARHELAQLDAQSPAFSILEQEQYRAYLGLAEYNLSHSAQGAERDALLDAAIESLERQLAEFPNGALAERAAYYLAEALYSRRRLVEAVAAYETLLTRYPQHPSRAEACHALGVARQELGRIEGAIHCFEQFAKEFPNHPLANDSHRRRGEMLVTLAEVQCDGRRYQASAKTLKGMLAEYPESALVPRALFDLARVQLAQSELDEAEASLDQCLPRCTGREVAVEARLLRAQVRHARGNCDGGLADANATLAEDPRRFEALHVRGLCEIGLHRPEDAIETLAAAIESDSKHPHLDRVLYDLAWAYEESRQPEQAAATYARLVTSCPRSSLVAECQFRRGEAQFATGRYADAAESFATAAREAKDAPLREKSTHKLGWCRFYERSLAEAQAAFDRQVAEQPNGPLAADARLLAAECLFQRRQFLSALQRFTAALDDRSASESVRSLAIVHAAQAAAELNDWPQSLSLAERALAEFPSGELVLEARCERGIALCAVGRLDEAERELATVAAGNTGLPNLRAELGLGQVYVARRQSDEAVRMFFKVAYGHGGSAAPAEYHRWQAEAIYLAAQTLEEMQRPESARKLYQEIIDDYPSSDRAAFARHSLENTVRR